MRHAKDATGILSFIIIIVVMLAQLYLRWQAGLALEGRCNAVQTESEEATWDTYRSEKVTDVPYSGSATCFVGLYSNY